METHYTCIFIVKILKKTFGSLCRKETNLWTESLYSVWSKNGKKIDAYDTLHPFIKLLHSDPRKTGKKDCCPPRHTSYDVPRVSKQMRELGSFCGCNEILSTPLCVKLEANGCVWQWYKYRQTSSVILIGDRLHACGYDVANHSLSDSW